jgi:hypothetical protein
VLWRLNPDTLKAFKSVHVLTYLFKDSFLQAYLDINKIPYFIRNKTEEEALQETINGSVLKPFHKLIHPDELILEPKNFKNKDLQTIYPMSSSWFKKYRSIYKVADTNILRTKLKTYFQKELTFTGKKSKKENRLWTTLIKAQTLLVGSGYKDKNSFLAFNTRATNSYINMNHLAFIYNVFYPQRRVYSYLKSKGVDISSMEDAYALSTLIQWIFRSSVRKGEHIDILLPSSRMRDLLDKWIKDIGNLYDSTRYIRNNINNPIITEDIAILEITTVNDFVSEYQPGLRHLKTLNEVLSEYPKYKVYSKRKKTLKKVNQKKTVVKRLTKKTRVRGRK